MSKRGASSPLEDIDKRHKGLTDPSEENPTSMSELDSDITMGSKLESVLEAINKKLDGLDELRREVQEMKTEMTKTVNSLTKKVEVLENKVYELERDRDTLTNAVQATKEENADLKVQVESQHRSLARAEVEHNALEQYTRRWSLVVHGLAEGNNETKQDCIDKCCKLFTESVGVKVTQADIEIAHRLGAKDSDRVSRSGGGRGPVSGTGGTQGTGGGGESEAAAMADTADGVNWGAGDWGEGTGGQREERKKNTRPIIIRFHSRMLRESVLVKRRLLKGKNISIGEDMTNKNYKLLKRASSHPATESAWYSKGQVVAKLVNGLKVKLDITSDVLTLLNEKSRFRLPRDSH